MRETRYSTIHWLTSLVALAFIIGCGGTGSISTGSGSKTGEGDQIDDTTSGCTEDDLTFRLQFRNANDNPVVTANVGDQVTAVAVLHNPCVSPIEIERVEAYVVGITTITVVSDTDTMTDEHTSRCPSTTTPTTIGAGQSIDIGIEEIPFANEELYAGTWQVEMTLCEGEPPLSLSKTLSVTDE